MALLAPLLNDYSPTDQPRAFNPYPKPELVWKGKEFSHVQEEDRPLSSRVSLRSGEQQAGRVYHLHHLQPLSGCPGEGNVPRWRPEPRAALAEANGMRWGPRHLGAGWGARGQAACVAAQGTYPGCSL